MKSILFWFGLLAFAGVAHAADNLLANPSFEDGTTGWYPACCSLPNHRAESARIQNSLPTVPSRKPISQ